MSEEFSFDFDIDEKSMKKLRESLGLEKLEEIHKRFKNGIETEDDLINHYESYKIKCVLPDEPKKETELNVVETKYYKKIIDLYQKEKEKNKKLENADLTNVYLSGFYDGEKKWKDKISGKIEELDIEIQQCEYADDDIEEYKNDMEKEKSRLLRDRKILQELLEENNGE